MFLLNQFFPPDSAPTGQLLADVASQLAAEGQPVTVVCARPSYAGLARAVSRRDAAADPRLAAVRVVHTPAPPFGRSHAARLASWASYYAGALWRALRSESGVVLTLTTPPLLGVAGYLAHRLRRARHFIWEMDLYPDVAVALNTFRPGGLAERFTGLVADFTRRRADGIIVLGPCMRDRLIARGIPPHLIHVIHNWAPDGIRPRPMPPGPLTVLYSGNLGAAHDAHTIALAMRALGGAGAPACDPAPRPVQPRPSPVNGLYQGTASFVPPPSDANGLYQGTTSVVPIASKEDPGFSPCAPPRFRFVFAGGGPRRAGLERFCRDNAVANVEFLPYQDGERMAAHLAACHIGLVTQIPETLGCVVPSKTYPLMAAGRPILFIGPPESTPARIIDRFDCGWHLPPGDPEPLVDLLHLLADHPELVAEAGRRARHAYETHFTREIAVNKITEILTTPVARPLQAAALGSQPSDS